MSFPITSAFGNFLVGTAIGATVSAVSDQTDANLVGQIGIGIGGGLIGASVTRGHFLPYAGGVAAGALGYSLLTD